MQRPDQSSKSCVDTMPGATRANTAFMAGLSDEAFDGLQKSLTYGGMSLVAELPHRRRLTVTNVVSAPCAGDVIASVLAFSRHFARDNTLHSKMRHRP